MNNKNDKDIRLQHLHIIDEREDDNSNWCPKSVMS